MTFTKLGVVIPLGGVGDSDVTSIFAPAPLLLDGRTLLYYTGTSPGKTRVLLAASDDGIHFTKLGVVIPSGAFRDFDFFHTSHPAPLLLNGRVLLYYTGEENGTLRIGLAASDDGVHFTKLGVVISLGGAGDFDDVHTMHPSPLLLDGRIFLYYTGRTNTTNRVGLAVSDDGVHFTKLGVVIPLGANLEFDDNATQDPAPLLLDGRALLYYTGHDGGQQRVGLAASNDGVHFTKLGVIIPLGAGGQFDSFLTLEPAPLLLDGRVLLYYTGHDSTTYRVGLAASNMGV